MTETEANETTEQSDSPSVSTEDAIAFWNRNDRRFNLNFKPSPDNALFTLEGVPVLHRGGLSVVQGDPGSGKTEFSGGLLAAAIAPEGATGDFLGWKRETPERGASHLDIEQSREDHHAFCQRVLDRAGVQRGNSYLDASFHSYSCNGISLSEIRRDIEFLAHASGPILHIDGYADLLESVMDPAESDELVRWLMRLATKHNKHIIGVMHVNPSSGGRFNTKARGHLGSQLKRKAETVLELKRKGDGSVHIYTDKARKEPIPKDSAVRMHFDTAQGRWASLESVSDSKERERSEASQQLLAAAWSEDVSTSYGFTDLSRIFADSLALSLSAGKKKVGSLTTEKLINSRTVSGGRKSYELTPTGKALLGS